MKTVISFIIIALLLSSCAIMEPTVETIDKDTYVSMLVNSLNEGKEKNLNIAKPKRPERLENGDMFDFRTASRSERYNELERMFNVIYGPR